MTEKQKAQRFAAKIEDRIHRFRDEYRAGPAREHEPNIRALVLHPETAAFIAKKGGVRWSITEIHGYPYIESWHVPRGEVRVVPEGHLEFIEYEGTIYAWPHVPVWSKKTILMPTLRRGPGLLHISPGVDDEVREKIQDEYQGLSHPTMGPPTIRVRGNGSHEYFIIDAEFKYYNPRGAKACTQLLTSREFIFRARGDGLLFEKKLARQPVPEPEPMLAHVERCTADETHSSEAV